MLMGGLANADVVPIGEDRLPLSLTSMFNDGYFYPAKEHDMYQCYKEDISSW